MTYYVDTSAAVKLVVSEHGSRPLLRWAEHHEGRLASSDLLRTELMRAVRRRAPTRMERAREVLDSIAIVTVPTSTFERAGTLERLVASAGNYGITVLSPR